MRCDLLVLSVPFDLTIRPAQETLIDDEIYTLARPYRGTGCAKVRGRNHNIGSQADANRLVAEASRAIGASLRRWFEAKYVVGELRDWNAQIGDPRYAHVTLSRSIDPLAPAAWVVEDVTELQPCQSV